MVGKAISESNKEGESSCFYHVYLTFSVLLTWKGTNAMEVGTARQAAPMDRHQLSSQPAAKFQ